MNLKGPLASLIHARRSERRNVSVAIVASHAQLGVGKTTLGIELADYLDQSDGGFDASKCAQDPWEAIDLYQTLPKRSALLMDDAGVLIDPRRSMKTSITRFSHFQQTMRYREIHLVLTAPSIDYMDKRARQLVDLIIRVHRRGSASVYLSRLNFQGQRREKLLQDLRFTSIPEEHHLLEVYEAVEHQKAIRMQELQETKEATTDTTATAQERRIEMEKMAQHGLTQTQIAEIIGTTQPRVSQILSS